MRYKIDKKIGKINIIPESLDDIWISSLIIHKNDFIASKSTRRFKADSGKDEKKQIWVKIKIEKKILDLENERCRFIGIVVDAKPKEYVSNGEHHSLDITIGRSYDIYKEEILDYEIDYLKLSQNIAKDGFFAVIMDDENATIYKVSFFNYKKIADFKNHSLGKRYAKKSKTSFFDDIFNIIKESKPSNIIIAGPGFARENFKNFLKEKGISSYSIALNSISTTGVIELIKSKSFENLVKDFAVKQDLELMNEAVKKISLSKKDIVYGLNNALSILKDNPESVKKILVSSNFFNENFSDIKEFFVKALKKNAKMHIIDSKNTAGQSLDSFGGIILFLYYDL